MVFLFIIVILIFVIIFSKIRIEIINLKFISNAQKHLNKDYSIIFKICILKYIPVIKLEITDKKVKKLNLKKKMENINIQKLEKNININKIKEILKKHKFIIKKLKLKIEIGTENSAFTAMIVVLISTIISFFLKNKIENHKKQKFNVKPLFINKNLINIDFSGIFEMKLIHIINIIYILNRKEGVKNYERTSNRRSYAYSY